jgi:ATP/maltotriose-dependent transcriptional regulator MalT
VKFASTRPDFLYFEMICRGRSTFVQWIMGDYAGAHKERTVLLERFNAAAAEKGPGIEVLSSIVSCLVGNFLINTDHVEAGLQKGLRGYELARKTTNAILISNTTALLAEGYYLAGEYHKAISLLEELDSMPYKQTTKFLCILSDLTKGKVFPLVNKQEQLKQLFELDIQAHTDHALEILVSNIAKARYQLAEGKITEALDQLQAIAEEAEPAKAQGILTDLDILKAKGHFLLQEEQKAMDSLLQALLRTQSTALVRMYVNEGEEIEDLLKATKAQKKSQSNKSLDPLEMKYINAILQAFDAEKSRQKFEPNEDELSSRELDTLELIALGLSNQEIAAKLFISNNTVKTHVRNILFKLEAKNRNDAVLIAKEKGIVSD